MSTQTTTTEAVSGAEGLSKPAPGDLTYRSEWEASREISHDEAREIARRLIASHFRRTDTENARASIPANPDRDDDLLICSYIKQQARKATAPQPAGAERVDLAELERLSAEAAPGLWRNGPRCIFAKSTNPFISGDDVVVSTAYSDRSHDDDDANCAYIAALVNAHRAGHLVPASLPAALGSGEGTAVRYAERLAEALYEKHWRESSPNWKPLTGDMVGLLSQIDNMTAGLMRQTPIPDARQEALGKGEDTAGAPASPSGSRPSGRSPATPGVVWSAWPETEADSDPSDPGVTYCTKWFIGRWPVGAEEPECRILIGAGRTAEIIACRITEKLTSILNTDRLRATPHPQSPYLSEVEEAALSRAHADGIRAADWTLFTHEQSLAIRQKYLPAALATLTASQEQDSEVRDNREVIIRDCVERTAKFWRVVDGAGQTEEAKDA